MFEHFLHHEVPFTVFGQQHFASLLTFILFAISIIWIAHDKLNEKQQVKFGLVLFFVPILCVIGRASIVSGQQGYFNYQEDLPLHICRVIAVALPFTILLNKKKLFGILYFWTMAGTINSILTPDIESSFPHFKAWVYWIYHGGLIIAVLYGVFIFKWRPRLRDFWNAIIFANIYMIIIHIVNLMLGSNYMYTVSKPPASILDLFGPWPIYIFVTEFIGIILFLIAYLPFYKKEKAEKYSSFQTSSN